MASWQAVIEETVRGMGYDLVELERSAGGLLRVTLDFPWQAGQPEQAITVEDCERVTRQLRHTLEVEGTDYRRLEVASPGIDRPLNGNADCLRFAGSMVDLTLKQALGEAAAGSGLSANRKKFRGTLETVEESTDHSLWRLVWSDEPTPKPGVRVSKKKTPAPLQAMTFSLDEVREIRLASIVNFKGRSALPALNPTPPNTDPKSNQEPSQ
ncbi:MAG: ribosome maturation factor RimP [Brachymonas sp.]